MTGSDNRQKVVEADAGIFDVARAIAVLKTYKWTIASAVAAALILATLYLLVTPPVYRSDALLQVQQENNTALPGMDMLQELSGTPINTADAEIQIIRSRSVLGATVDKLNLSTVVEPRYFPLVGYAIARFRSVSRDAASGSESVDAGNWLTNFLWSRAGVNVERFNIPSRLFEEEFTLRALGTRTFALFDPDGKQLLRGTVGQVSVGELPSGEAVEIFVSEIEPSGFPSNYTVTKKHWLEAVGELQNSVAVAEQGRDSSILGVSLEGTDSQSVTRIVNNIAETYLRQNVEARSEQAERRLEFLNEQLPELQNDVEAAESRLNFYRQENRAIDLGAEARALLEQVVSIEQRISEFQVKRAELQQTYTSEHPYIKAIDVQIGELRRDRQQMETEIAQLPETEREMLGLQRDVSVNTALYVQLLNNAQELRLMKAGTTGNVRIIDKAVLPVEPVKPQTAYILVVAVLFGLVVGIAVAFARAAMRSRMADPSNIEKVTGLPIYAAIPQSDWQQRKSRRKRPSETADGVILALDKPDELANEALRSLRTSIHFARRSAGKPKMLITGPAPGVGKSFVSVNLAVLLAESGKSVILIDGDLRKGHLHKYLDGAPAEAGLAEILSGDAIFDDVARRLRDTTVTVVPRGTVPPNPAELLMRPALKEVLELAERRHDIILVDAPPVLAVSDAAVLASAMSDASVFMVVRAGQQGIGEVEEAVRRLAIHQCEVSGIVFNGVRKRDLEADSEHSYYYQYEY